MNAPFALATESVAIVDLRDPSEIARIDGFVSDMCGSIFHLPAWLKAVEQGSGQKAAGLVAEKSGMVTGWLPLTDVHSPVFGRALVSSGFAVGGGPLASGEATIRRLCRAAEELAIRRSATTIELRSSNAPSDWHHTSETHCGFECDLAADDEAQLLAIPRKQRAEVRKSLKLDLKVTTGRDEAHRNIHYAVYAESVRNLGTPVFPRSLFDAMLDAFPQADILTVSHADTPVASVLSFYHHGAVMPYWGGGLFAARNLRANERMYFELMLHARKRGMERFDFGRSKTGSGPYSYKKNWGFKPQPLSYAAWTAPGHETRDINPNSDAYTAKIELWKKLPLSLANSFGPFLAKGLA